MKEKQPGELERFIKGKGRKIRILTGYDTEGDACLYLYREGKGIKRRFAEKDELIEAGKLLVHALRKMGAKMASDDDLTQA